VTHRVTTITYDAAGRPTVTSVAVIPSADGGTPVPDITTGYDSSSGDATSVTGRHVDGNVRTRTDGKGTYTYTYTYTYDGTDANGKIEHRGLVTSLDTGMGAAPRRSPAATTPSGS
jgi:hypothetical protein